MLKEKVRVNRAILIVFIFMILVGSVYFFFRIKVCNQINVSLRGHLYDLGKTIEQVPYSFKEAKESEQKIRAVSTREVIKERKDIETEVRQMRQDIDELDVLVKEYRTLIRELQRDKRLAENQVEEFARILNNIEEEMRLWKGQIRNLSELELAQKLRKISNRELRRRRLELQRQARRRKDEIKLMLGNKGYMVRNGKSMFNRSKAVDLKLIGVEKNFK